MSESKTQRSHVEHEQADVAAEVVVRVRGDVSLSLKLKAGHTKISHIKDELRTWLSTQEVNFNGQTRMVHADELLVFDDSTATLLADDADVQELAPLSVAVFEVFTTTPVPLYRVISPYQAHPAVLSDNPSDFSRIAPLFCAGFTPEEAKVPAFHVEVSHRGTETSVRGVSLRPSVPPRLGVQPTDPVDRDEAKGWSYFPLEELPPSPLDNDPYGDVHTATLFHHPPRFSLRTNAVAREKSAKETPGRKDETTTRRIYLSFELPPGTDLAPLGFAVVFDKYEGEGAVDGNHFSLIPWPDQESFPAPVLANPPLWREDYALVPPPPHVYQRMGAHPIHHSECIDDDKYDGVYFFPFVCQQFRAHNIVWLLAGATPSGDDVPPDHPRYKDAVTLAHATACLSTSELKCYDTISLAIALDKLVAADYDAHVLELGTVRTLRKALHSLSFAFKPEHYVNTIKDAIDILDDAEADRTVPH